MGIYEGYTLPKDIVMISTADWDAPLWTNKQQIASRLVSDFRVVYVEPLVALGKGKRGYSHRYWTDSSGVYVYRPPAAIPFGNKFEQVNEINHNLVSQSIKQYIGELGFEEYILWVYTPTGAPYLNTLTPVLSCYDCVDEYSAFPGAWITKTLRMEGQLLGNVDAVFTTAKTLYEEKSKKNPNTHFIPNVGDFDHFSKALTMKPNRHISTVKKPVIGFVGALNYKLDNDLLEELFQTHTDWTFAFVGPDRGFGMERYVNLPNVVYYGLRTINELPGFLSGFDVCIIPYKVDRYTMGVLPIKFYEYLASGKPIVSTAIPELTGFSNMIGIASNADQFGYAIEQQLAKDNAEKREKRIALAKANSWESRIHSILQKLEDTYRRKMMGIS